MMVLQAAKKRDAIRARSSCCCNPLEFHSGNFLNVEPEMLKTKKRTIIDIHIGIKLLTFKAEQGITSPFISGLSALEEFAGSGCCFISGISCLIMRQGSF